MNQTDRRIDDLKAAINPTPAKPLAVVYERDGLRWVKVESATGEHARQDLSPEEYEQLKATHYVIRVEYVEKGAPGSLPVML